jgi:amino acid permease
MSSAKDSVTPLTSGVTIINVMLGTGPIIIPFSFLLGGVGLSTIFTIIVVYFSYQSSEMIVELLSICNALKYKKGLMIQEDKASNYSNNINNASSK